MPRTELQMNTSFASCKRSTWIRRCSQRPLHAASIWLRITPRTPQRSSLGVSRRSSMTRNMFAEIALITWPSISSRMPSVTSPLKGSELASTCSSRFRCLIPPRAGCIASLRSQIHALTPRAACSSTLWGSSCALTILTQAASDDGR